MPDSMAYFIKVSPWTQGLTRGSKEVINSRNATSVVQFLAMMGRVSATVSTEKEILWLKGFPEAGRRRPSRSGFRSRHGG
jgi:hypothetical protein